MVYRYSVKTDDVINFMQQYDGSLPKNHMQGTYDSSDFEYVIRDNFNMSSFSYKRLIVKLKQEKIIHVQKYKRDGYGMYMSHWLDNKKLLEKYGINVYTRNENNITNKVVSHSLAENLIGFADNMQSDDKHLWQIACNTIYRKAVNDKHDRHFTINNKGAMTYTPIGRMTATTEDKERWLSDKKYRSDIKFGKGLRKIFKHQNIKIPDNIIEFFANKLKGMYTFQGKITVVSGSYIRDWYNGNIYAKYNTESLGNSCMRHDSCQNYFDIYTENDDKVKMIIALDDENMLIGRAILWNTDSHGLFCDRIYGKQMTIEAIKSYAKKLGAYTKYEQSYSNTTLVSPTGEADNNEITITLNTGGFEYYPYMDTLKYSDDISNDDEIVLSSENGDYCLESTDGGPNDDYVTLENGDRIHEDEANYIDRYSEWYHSEDCVYSEYHGEHIIYDRAISINGGNDYAWDDCDDFKFVEEEEEYYHYEDVVWSEYHTEYLHNYDECVIHGIISVRQSNEIVVNGTNLTCHINVTIEELLENEIITEEEYENHVTNG
jgi:hypothetical protein